jgi:peptidoglycan/xylan/chitin deacetylase (PgdA/CDA1 family)
MNTLNKPLYNSLAVVSLALFMAGCGATAQTGTDGDRAIRDSFESEEYFVVIAKNGDTAASLAARFLGDASKDWMIEDFNNLSTFSPGQQVVIPKRYWNLSGVRADGYQLVPVLCYHNLAPQSKGRMILAAKVFEEQMRYLKNQGYHVINLKEFIEFVSLKRQLPRRSVLLTFDDGYRSFRQYALPVLQELGFTATLFVYTDYVGAGSNAFTWADLKKLQQEGFDVQAHSKSHGDMLRASSEPAGEYEKRLEAELAQPRALFQKNLGFAPEFLAYPYGRQDDAVVRRTKDRGYTAAFTVRRQGSPSFVDPYRINRSQIYPEMSMDDFIKNLNLFNQEEIK